MKRVTLLDYGAGNISSVVKALEHLGCAVNVAASPAEVRAAERIVLPGVGHFSATARLRESGMEVAAVEAIEAGKPFLGICVGLQWLFAGSAEAPDTPGAGVLRGQCERLRGSVKVPHVGWNELEQVRGKWLLAGVPEGTQVYFTHSYAAPVTEETVAVTEHGAVFASAVERGRLGAVQFHPEKSGDAGLQVLANFLELPC